MPAWPTHTHNVTFDALKQNPTLLPPVSIAEARSTIDPEDVEHDFSTTRIPASSYQLPIDPHTNQVGTITCGRDSSTRHNLNFDGKRYHTMRELMNYQTLPPGYKLQGTLTEKVRMIGNAFPTVPASKFLVEIRKSLEATDAEDREQHDHSGVDADTLDEILGRQQTVPSNELINLTEEIVDLCVEPGPTPTPPKRPRDEDDRFSITSSRKRRRPSAKGEKPNQLEPETIDLCNGYDATPSRRQRIVTGNNHGATPSRRQRVVIQDDDYDTAISRTQRVLTENDLRPTSTPPPQEQRAGAEDGYDYDLDAAVARSLMEI